MIYENNLNYGLTIADKLPPYFTLLKQEKSLSNNKSLIMLCPVG
jgi:hypothetical protein